MSHTFLRHPRLYLMLVLGLTAFAASSSYAAKPTVEWIASEIATRANANPEFVKQGDGILSASARAEGKNVILKYVVRTKRDIGRHELTDYRSELYQDLVPKTCRANGNNPAFRDGLFYTFLYVNQYGQELAEIMVSKRVCDRSS